jgi:hypothetical protein
MASTKIMRLVRVGLIASIHASPFKRGESPCLLKVL